MHAYRIPLFLWSFSCCLYLTASLFFYISDSFPLSLSHTLSLSRTPQVVKHTRKVSLGQITWKKFPDGFPNIFVHDVESIKGCDVVFLACFSQAGEIFEQMSVLCSLPQYAPHSVKIILPFFPVGTMERVDREGEIATARTLARILSSVPPCRGGPLDLVIFDIHALQERFYFGDNVIPVLQSGVPLLLRKLEQLALASKDQKFEWTIAFPDMGAYMRYNHMFSAFDTIICMKVHPRITEILLLKSQPFWNQKNLLHIAFLGANWR